MGILKNIMMATATFDALLTMCPQVNAAPNTIGYDGSNPTATSHLHEQLGKTATVTAYINDKEYALTEAETAQLLQLLQGAQASAPRCAPDDCFYLNFAAADGSWLMSLPVQNTPEGITLLYLKLQGNNAAGPLQNWWRGVTSRLGL